MRERSSLALLDQMLLSMDGFDACRAIRRTPTVAIMPIAMLTAKSSDEDVGGVTLAGLGTGRGRLHHQSVFVAGADRPHQGRAMPPSLAPGVDLCARRDGPRSCYR